MSESVIEWFHPFDHILLCSFLFMVGCATQIKKDEAETNSSQGVEHSTDCGLLSIATEHLDPNERDLTPPILSGCPGVYAGRIRTRTEQRAFDDVLAENPAPTRILALGVEAERQYNRLVKKGVPPSLAAKLLE